VRQPGNVAIRLGAAAALALAVALGAALAPVQAQLRVAESIDLHRYAGKWFEVARFPNKFQRRCATDVVASYRVRPDGRLDVVNQCRTADGETEQARGLARKAGKSGSNAVLQVRFAPAILSFLPRVWGDYWILALGPDYTWAVIGTPSREFLWILSRTPRMSASSYEQAIEIARASGFDTARLVRTPQKY
jgi:apolipoprotein D and lipocalin family protein